MEAEDQEENSNGVDGKLRDENRIEIMKPDDQGGNSTGVDRNLRDENGIEMNTLAVTNPDTLDVDKIEKDEQLKLGIVQTVVEIVLKQCSLPQTWSVAITILIALIINIADGAGDIGLGLLLYNNGYVFAALVVFAIDYLAMFLTVSHFVMASLSSKRPIQRLAFEVFILVLLHPFAPSVSLLFWFCARQTGDPEIERHSHFLAKLTITVTSMFEAPLQVIATSWLALTGRIDTPWTGNTEICDSFGNCIFLGYFSVFVYSVSWIALLKASIDVFSVCDTYSLVVFLLPTIVFRLFCFIGLFSYSTIWSFALLIPLLVTNIIVTGKHNKKQSGINLFTSVFCSTFLTTIVAKDPSIKEQTGESNVDREALISMTAIMSFIHLPIIFLAVLLVFVCIKFSLLKTDPRLKLDQDQMTFLLIRFLTPLFLLSFLSTAWFYFVNKKNSYSKTFKVVTNSIILGSLASLFLYNIFSLPESSGPVHCIWDTYGNWSSCSSDGGLGVKTRVRERKSEELLGGDPCHPGDEEDTVPCIGKLALVRNRSCQSLNLRTEISERNTSRIIDAAICNKSGKNGVDFYEECGSPTPLVFSCEDGNLDAVKILIVLGSNVHFSWSSPCCGNCSSQIEVWVNGRDCLYVASSRGFLEMAKYIWPLYQDKGGIDDAKKSSCSGCGTSTRENWTPLHIASKEGHLEMVEFLIENGANPNTKTGEEKTAMKLADENNHGDIVQYLSLKN
eukprot:GFUD01012849.1.p1 GENE.GFUD01012849.1~~GFUD01012849.1.p1  ORF type:complete len:731 (+),score=129.14 GFUD01012849.1:183-2375(+)